MGLLGGSRIDGLTIFLVICLILYTILVGGVYATFTSDTFTDPYAGKTINVGEIGDYTYNDIENITRPLFTNDAYFEDLDPNGKITWWNDVFGDDYFLPFRLGIDWWDGWVFYPLEPERIYEQEIINDFNDEQNYTRYFCDRGGKLETTLFFCPLFYYNETSEEVTYIYDGIEESFENDAITIIMASNMSYTGFDIGKVMGLLTGFSTYDLPFEVSVIVSGIFWGLLVLTIVKLVIG